MERNKKLSSKLGDWMVLRYYQTETADAPLGEARLVQLLIELRLLGRKLIGQSSL